MEDADQRELKCGLEQSLRRGSAEPGGRPYSEQLLAQPPPLGLTYTTLVPFFRFSFVRPFLSDSRPLVEACSDAGFLPLSRERWLVAILFILEREQRLFVFVFRI